MKSALHVVGVDLGGTSMRLALADSTGQIVARRSTSTIGIRDADVIVALICRVVEELMQECALSRELLTAIAVGAPGVTDVRNGVVIATSYLVGWRNVPLQALLEAALDVPVAVDNDVNMAAFGESRMGVGRGIQNFVFLAVGTGVGAGIVLKSDLFRGDCWRAGEIGYMLVPGVAEGTMESDAPGPLEEIAGGEGIRKQWQSRWNAAMTSLPKEAVASAIFDHALQGNSLALEVLELAAQTLADAIYNVRLILDCDLFVLGGTVGLHPALAEATQRLVVKRTAGAGPLVIRSALGTDAQLLGAITMALETATTRPIVKAV